MSIISGIITALVTPLTPSGELDDLALMRLLDRQVAAGIDGIFVLGSVGEGALVPDALYERVAQQTAARVGGRAILLGGASDNSVARCLARLHVLARAGLQYGVLTLPFYGWPGRPEDSIRFFTEVAAASPLPIVAYNLPKAVGWCMPVELLESISAIPGIVAIKDTQDGLEAMRKLASSPRRAAHCAYLPGNTTLGARLLESGADGIVCTPANVFPLPFVQLMAWHREGRAEFVRSMDADLIPQLTSLLTIIPSSSVASIKGMLEADGICGRQTMAPWPSASDEEIAACGQRLLALKTAIDRFRSTVRQSGATEANIP